MRSMMNISFYAIAMHYQRTENLCQIVSKFEIHVAILFQEEKKKKPL